MRLTVSIFVRQLCTNNCRINSDKTNHEYLKNVAGKSLKECVDFLTRNVIYNADNLVVLSKPNGLASAPFLQVDQNKKPTTTRTKNAVPFADRPYSLLESLPYLAKNLGYDSLTIVKTPDRYTSGVTVLSPCEEVAEKVRNTLVKANAQGHFCSHYRAVVLGSPEPFSGHSKVALKLEKNPVVNNDKKPVVLTAWSKKNVKHQVVKVFRVQHKTLYKNDLASLVEICPSATKWNFIRVYLSHLLSPILGDNLYGSRVHNLMGVSVAVNPFSDSASAPQKLQEEIKSLLSIEPGQESIIPVHLHLHKLIIPHYYGKNKSFEIEATPPSSFQWTCDRLGITPTRDLNSSMRMTNG